MTKILCYAGLIISIIISAAYLAWALFLAPAHSVIVTQDASNEIWGTTHGKITEPDGRSYYQTPATFFLTKETT